MQTSTGLRPLPVAFALWFASADICATRPNSINPFVPMTRPTFDHPVFNQLFERDYHIDAAVLHQILALGPEIAVPELLKITSYTLDNFDYEQAYTEDWYAHYQFLHALYLLYALHAPEVLDVYRQLLRLDDGEVEFWFSDALYEEVPELLARAAEQRLPDLLALLDDGDILFQQRLVPAQAVSYLARTQPALRPAISEFLQRHLRRIAADPGQFGQRPVVHDETMHYTIEDYLGGLLVDIQEAGLTELEPEMRALHRLGIVDEAMAGSEDDFDFDTSHPLAPPLDIFALYQKFRDDPDDYSPHNPNAAAIAVRRAREEARMAQLRREALARRLPPQPRQISPKIGRNDPCPCGSGQKYKKCHGA